MNVYFTIKGELTDLNAYIQAERGNRFAAAKIKETETHRVKLEILNQKVEPVGRIATMIVNWYTRDNRKDADNVQFAVKYLLDGMVKAGTVHNDSRKYTGMTSHIMHVDAQNPRVEIELVV